MNNNVKSVLWLAAMTLEDMAQRAKNAGTSGSFIVVGSIGGLIANTVIGAYGISKAADHHLVRNLAAEWGPKNVRVNAIAPGLMNTENALADLPTPLIDEFVQRLQLVHRLGTMDDVVSAMLFLCSDEASFITGETLKVSGGYPLNF